MTPDLFGPEGDCTPEEAAAAVKAVRATDPVTVVRAHQTQPGHPDAFGSCCEVITLDVVRAALDGDARRLRDLADAALAPWRDA